MRSAKANDFWKDVYKKQYANYIKTITISDCMGYSGTIPFKGGITAICGLNGVGKSTLLSCIKSVIGIEDDSIFTNNKVQGVVGAELVVNRKEITLSASESAVKNGFQCEFFQYIDSNQSIELLKLWAEQTNLEEYLEGFEAYSFTTEELEEISWLIGKTYEKCISIETQEETNYKQVFFQVTSNRQSYTSKSMGVGEHSILYMYYILKKSISKDTFVIIEEPESYISISSQQRFMDFIAERISTHRISVVLTTHSPYILRNIRNENTLLVSNIRGKMHITLLGDDIDAESHLGLKKNTRHQKIATIFVEDYLARIFLETLLNEEAPILTNQVDIVSVNGENQITKRISFDDSKYMSYKFIGIYDGDMREKLDIHNLKWPHNFLPVKSCVEKEIFDYIYNDTNLSKVIENLSLNQNVFYTIIAEHEGEDCHDWFSNICMDANIEQSSFIKAFYLEWKNENSESISQFINFILVTITGESYSNPRELLSCAK